MKSDGELTERCQGLNIMGAHHDPREDARVNAKTETNPLTKKESANLNG